MKKVLSVFFLIVLFVFLTAPGVFADEFPKQKLRFANLVPENYPTTKADQFVADELNKRTNGAITVKMFHNATLGGATEIIDLVGEGGIALGNFTASDVFSRLPMQAFWYVPLVYPDVPAVTALTTMGWRNSPKMQEDLKKNNLYPFNMRGLPEVQIISKKPFKNLEDLKGKKIRTWGAIYPKLLKELGMVPVNMQFHEVYEGLQRGTIDGCLGGYPGMYVMKIYEVAKYISTINFGADICYASYVNLDRYNKWSPELQRIFNQIVVESEALSDQTVIGFTQYAKSELVKNNLIEIVEFEDQEKVDSYRDYVIDLTVQTIVSQGAEYEQPAKDYATWLKKALAERKK